MRPRLRPFADINITSIADVAITLLIIFIIAGSAGAFQKTGVKLNLPRTSAAKVLPQEGVVVTITKDLQVTVEDQPVKGDEFIPALTQAMTQKNASQVFLQADAGVPYGVVIDIVGKVREAGFENLGLIAEPKAKGTR
jgi:biopolymer transport protein ExbD